MFLALKLTFEIFYYLDSWVYLSRKTKPKPAWDPQLGSVHVAPNDSSRTYHGSEDDLKWWPWMTGRVAH